ncbi:hypothetical protein ABT173_48045 [Streptomyces sp. NPDC001795]|uniref:hypothetical protein n=1 Tax=unclassified Streptomyces TaxID=2593676 RepID=UPI00332B9358
MSTWGIWPVTGAPCVAVLDENDQSGGRTRPVRGGGLTLKTGAMSVYRGARAEKPAVEIFIRS